MAAGQRLVIVFLIGIVVCIQQAESWSGNFVNYRSCHSYQERVCTHSTWWGCCSHSWVWRESCNYYSRCQSGWRESTPGSLNCNTPICIPGCANGGTCFAPNRCICAPGYGGPTCDGILPCDILKPCYPGTCNRGGCTCEPGFSSHDSLDGTCRILGNPQKPEIFKCTSTIRNVERVQNREKYSYTVESANPNDTNVEVLWSNYRRFNYIQMEGLAIYDPMLPARPEYVSDSKLGVVNAEVTVTHTKISRTPGQIETSYRATWPCVLTNTTDCRNVASIGQFVCGSRPCLAMNTSYTVSFETGDNFTMSLRFFAGGFRNVIGRGTQEFYRSQDEKTLHFRFDSAFPEHDCMNNTHNCSLSDKPLDVGPMFTKNPISLRWGGWRDRVSGMYRYVWEVFPLQPNGDGELRETAPLSPVNDITTSVVNHSNIQFPTYTPPQAGFYSVILHASDRANNTVYVRQFVVYDPAPVVSVDNASPMTVAEVNQDRPLWVNNLNSTLTLNWSGHFLNKMHEDKKVFGPILPYPRQFQEAERDDFGRAKYVWDEVSFGPGQSQMYVRPEVPNARGIRRFWVQETGDTDSPSEQRWTLVSLSLNHQFPSENRKDGDKRRLWVKAEDSMSTTVTDFIPIAFDSSAPVFDGQIKQERNVKSSVYHFASRISLSATDAQSAVTAFRLQFIRNDTGTEVYNETKWRNPEVPYSQCSGTSCTCLKQNAECYQRQVSIDVNNCWLQIDRVNVTRTSVNVIITPINDAGLPGPSTIQQFNDLTSLDGILNYAGPTNVTTSLLTAESVRLSWTNMPTCYEVTEWWVKYYDADGKEHKHYVDRRESVFMLPGLGSSTTYNIYIMTGYNGTMSEPAIIIITTLKGPLTQGQIAGIVIGSLLLLLIILAIIVAILYMNGTLFILLRRPVPENRYRPSFMKRREKLSTGGVDGDVYIYGGDVAVPLGKQIADDRLTLIEVIKEGRFARIYKANLNTNGKNETMAAKMLKEDRMTMEDVELMKTKMAFMTREVPSHPNVLQCLGGIMESPWGPVMVLEFCENDTLLSWLSRHQKDVTDDVVERLYHFAHGVLKGMERLSSAKIVHKRLAARNVLLTFTMDVKITGFGPTHLPGEEDQVKERLPVRWLPPECATSLQNAEESTDVWSFGVTLWEIFSMGENPYSNVDAHSIALAVRQGRRLSKPEYCDETNYAMMQRCWTEKPSKRPTFKQMLREYDRTMSGDHRQSTYNYGNPTYLH